jgi:hypothetical protein
VINYILLILQCFKFCLLMFTFQGYRVVIAISAAWKAALILNSTDHSANLDSSTCVVHSTAGGVRAVSGYCAPLSNWNMKVRCNQNSMNALGGNAK